MSARWIDVEAPYDLALATVAAREALVGPRRDPSNLAGSCQTAAHAVALGLRRRGRKALCLPGECEDDHLVALVDGWVLDPTAEQFRTGGPWVCRVGELPSSDYRLNLWLEECWKPDEDELVHRLAVWSLEAPLLKACGLPDLIPRACDLSDRMYEERIRLHEEEW